LLTNVAGPAGTLLVLDDLQWAGSDALDLLATLVHGAAEIPLRVVGAYRTTEVGPHDPLALLVADLAHAGLVTHRLVPPLKHEEAARLLTALLPEQSAPATCERVIPRTGGVPFFLVSYAQGLAFGAPDALLDRRPAEDGGVPWEITQSIRQRRAAVPLTAQAILEVASVAGREVPRRLLAVVAAHPEQEVLQGLEAACRARLLEETQGAPGTGLLYRFTHDVIREVVEGDLSAARRMLLHRDIARALEELSGDPPIEVLAYHYGQTDEHARAAHWLEQAGDQATAGFANVTALGHYGAARERLVACAAGAEALARLEEKLGDLHHLVGEYAHAQEHFERARARAPDAARRAELARKEGLTWHQRGEYDQALAAFAMAEAEGGTDGNGTRLPGSVRAAIALSRGETLHSWGQYAAAQAAVERALTLLHAEDPGEATDRALARADHLQSRLAWRRGDLVQGTEWSRRSLAIYERLGDQQGLAAIWQDLGADAFHRGDLTQAEECSRHSLTISERVGDRHGISWACSFLSWFTLLKGDLVQAEAYARRGLAIAERSGAQRDIALAWTDVANAACERGDLDGAAESARRALAILKRSGHEGGYGGSALAWNLLGAVTARRGALAEAEECYRRSLDLMERLDASGFPAQASYTWQALGEVAFERGDLATAVAWYRRARHLARRGGASDNRALAALGLVRALLRGLPAGVRWRSATALLEQGCAMATAHGLALPAVRAALLRAEVYLRQGMLAEAQGAAEQARGLATSQQRRWEEGVAQRLVGQCALAHRDLATATAHLHASLALLTEMGAALEAARTRLALAEVLAGESGGDIPAEARTLLAEARAQFAASGAALDLAEADRLEML
jgi:tetratricopeptide (TPR) repeat protein